MTEHFEMNALLITNMVTIQTGVSSTPVILWTELFQKRSFVYPTKSSIVQGFLPGWVAQSFYLEGWEGWGAEKSIGICYYFFK